MENNNMEPSDLNIAEEIREVGSDSQSESEDLENWSGDYQQGLYNAATRTRKKYHRHTPHQTKELENFFREFPHPDETQRAELGARLGLEGKQIRIWFQNRRTQMKTQLERHENIVLKQQYKRLIIENNVLKESMKNPLCNVCGGSSLSGELSLKHKHEKMENCRLRNELNRVSSLMEKFKGDDNNNNLMDGDQYRNVVLTKLAFQAMGELMKMSQLDSPLWVMSASGWSISLNYEEYFKTFHPCIGTKPLGFTIEASRESNIIMMSATSLVEMLMNPNEWAQMFHSIVSEAAIVEVVSAGMGGTKDGMILLMSAAFHVLSPLVPPRQVKFVRSCKKHEDDVWVVVDVSADVNEDAASYTPSRRLPSGCIIHAIGDVYSKVTWVEHSEYDEGIVHQLYRTLISSGMGFGAMRWIATLGRQSDFSSISTEDMPAGTNNSMLKSVLSLAQRTAYNFCAGIFGTPDKWEKVEVQKISKDIRVLTRKNFNNLGEPVGVILSASTSVWMPSTRTTLFDFLSNVTNRNRWDILFGGESAEEMVRIPKGNGQGNCVSVLRSTVAATSPTTSKSNNMVIIQETWDDQSTSVIAYAPVDLTCMNLVMEGGDSSNVAILPSGFAIMPRGKFGHGESRHFGTSRRRNITHRNDVNGCLLTIGFQILVSSNTRDKVGLNSIQTVNHIISHTLQKIREAVL